MRFKANKTVPRSTAHRAILQGKCEGPNGHSVGGDDTKRCVLSSDALFPASGSGSQFQSLSALILSHHLQSLTEKTTKKDFNWKWKIFSHSVGAIYGTAAFGSAIEDFPKYFNSCNPKTKGDSLKEVLMGKLTISLSVSVDSKQWVLGQFVYIDGFLNYWIS